MTGRADYMLLTLRQHGRIDDRPQKRHRYQADAGDAPGDGGRARRRRRLRRRSFDRRAGTPHRRTARQGRRGLHGFGDDDQPSGAARAHRVRGRGAGRRCRPHRRAGARRAGGALRDQSARSARPERHLYGGGRAGRAAGAARLSATDTAADQASVSGEHAQHRRRHHLAVAGHRRCCRGGAGARPEAAPRWRTALECRRRDRRCRGGIRGAIRYRQRLLLEGAGRAGGLGARGIAGVHRPGAAVQGAVRRRHPAGGHRRRRRAVRARASPAPARRGSCQGATLRRADCQPARHRRRSRDSADQHRPLPAHGDGGTGLRRRDATPRACTCCPAVRGVCAR